TILYPTDTIWGIGCDATNPEAVNKIFNLKKRPERKGLIVLMADQKDIIHYVSAPDPQVSEYLKTVHKPTTVIYKGMVHLAENLSEDGTIAIRLVGDAFCRQLIKRLRRPLVSTSANFSGAKAPGLFKDISEEIKAGVDYVVKYRQEDETIREPSSLVKANPDGTVTVIRP
ncbi:MAG: L-threonylcarbamoyladenylate synthase, partial [Chitinophagales bacterium]